MNMVCEVFGHLWKDSDNTCERCGKVMEYEYKIVQTPLQFYENGQLH